MQGVEKGRGKNGYLHGREEEAGRRARQGAVRLQERDHGAGKCGLRMDLTGLWAVQLLWGKNGLWLGMLAESYSNSKWERGGKTLVRNGEEVWDRTDRNLCVEGDEINVMEQEDMEVMSKSSEKRWGLERMKWRSFSVWRSQAYRSYKMCHIPTKTSVSDFFFAQTAPICSSCTHDSLQTHRISRSADGPASNWGSLQSEC